MTTVNPVGSAVDSDFASFLTECDVYAQRGYWIASNHEKVLSKTLREAEEKVQQAMDEIAVSLLRAPETTQNLRQQLLDIQQAFYKLSFAFQEDLNGLHERLSKFSITLFGRTMAGKSTLMEFLRHGDGSSIGKGAPRTTRDVRTYPWHGLDITDVPGIGAFNGEEDEMTAFEAAKRADLIIFLLTDDGPKPVEAAFFSRVMDIGKPIICVVNIKKSITASTSIEDAECDINEEFDMSRLNEIRGQFLQYAEQFDQSWSHIPFVYVHLKSAFLSQHADSQEKSAAFYRLSRIDYLTRKILQQVQAKGLFLRVKTFIDIIATPLLESMESLLEHSQNSSIQGRTILKKKRQLDDWKQGYIRNGRIRINALITKIRSELEADLAAFAEDHFSDKDADKAWMRIIEGRKIEERCQDLLNDLDRSCSEHLSELSREIDSELRFAVRFSHDKSLRMHKIIDGKRLWNWSSLVVGGGLSIASGVSFLIGSALAGPLGWGALAVSVIGTIGSFLFKSREKREAEARASLEKHLRKSIDRICSLLEDQMIKKFDSLVSVRVTQLSDNMNHIISTVFSLADTQKELAWKLNRHLMELNSEYLTEAIKLIGADGLQYHVQSVARVPGNTCLLLLNEGTVFPDEQTKLLGRLMGEKISFVHDHNNKQTLIARIVGNSIDRRSIGIEDDIGVAHVPIKHATPWIKTRVRLAQQFTKLLIMNQ